MKKNDFLRALLSSTLVLVCFAVAMMGSIFSVFNKDTYLVFPTVMGSYFTIQSELLIPKEASKPGFVILTLAILSQQIAGNYFGRDMAIWLQGEVDALPLFPLFFSFFCASLFFLRLYKDKIIRIAFDPNFEEDYDID